jgi:hypothetical protein
MNPEKRSSHPYQGKANGMNPEKRSASWTELVTEVILHVGGFASCGSLSAAYVCRSSLAACLGGLAMSLFILRPVEV